MQYIVSMRIVPSLLRLLLAASLVLNGLGLPMPAHAMGAQHSQASIEHPVEHMPAHDDPSGQPPCHGESAVLVDTGADGVSVDPALPDPQPDPGSPGCCDGGNCDGVCMQSTCAVLNGRVFFSGQLSLAVDPRSMPAGLPAPALPHPIRPPIG